MDSFCKQTAAQLHTLYFGGNMTGVHIKEVLDALTFEQATASYKGLNTIYALAYHVVYYIHILRPTLDGKPLIGNDKESWKAPVVNDDDTWKAFLDNSYKAIEDFTQRIEQLSDIELQGDFIAPKYGSLFKNIQGLIEHTHYHLGQMALLKKLLTT